MKQRPSKNSFQTLLLSLILWFDTTLLYLSFYAVFEERVHAFSKYAKYFEKLIFVTPWSAQVGVHVTG